MLYSGKTCTGEINVDNPFRRTAAEKRTINFCYLHRVTRDGVQAKSGQPGVLLSQDGICVLRRDKSKVILLFFGHFNWGQFENSDTGPVPLLPP